MPHTTRTHAIVTLLLFAAALVSSESNGSQRSEDHARHGQSSLDGTYTKAQAARGKTVYAEECASCHLQDLSGDNSAPSLAGPAFLDRWKARNLDELVERIRTSMPADRPGTLSRQNSVDAVAYMLESSDVAAGDSELRIDRNALRQILIAVR